MTVPPPAQTSAQPDLGAFFGPAAVEPLANPATGHAVALARWPHVVLAALLVIVAVAVALVPFSHPKDAPATAAGADAGGDPATRESSPTAPLPSGAAVTSGHWRVVTQAVEWDADAAVAAASFLPQAPPDGWQWALLRVSVQNVGDQVADAGLLDVVLVGGSQSVSSRDAAARNPAPTFPSPLDRIALRPGDVRSGYLGYLVPVDARQDCVIRVMMRDRPGREGESFWVACA